tara:strand:+ start:1341 stop:1478 length:138 start_codon:yes stop_codon:yes gene_type:complete
MFRVRDKETGEVVYETNNIQDLSDYLYDKKIKEIKAYAAEGIWKK